MTPVLLLVDAMSIAYRAFHAISGLSTSAGRPSNAVYGFIKTLARVERIWKPSHCLVVFDGGLPAARTELLAEYKAQRPAMPPALGEQLGGIEEYLDCAGIMRSRIEGEEADDIIASAAAKAGSSGMEVLIVTGDKDLMQLVDSNTAILFPGKVEAKAGPAEILEKTGVRPDQVVDWLALTGDSSDNIPGVPGVGAKTAARWLNQWNSLESILTHLHELKPERLRAGLAENRATVDRNVRMMTLDRTLDLSISIDDMKIKTPDTARLIEFYEKMEFDSLARDLKTPTLL